MAQQEIANDFGQAVTWNQGINETISRIQDDLVKNDGASLKGTVSQLAPDDFQIVDTRFRARFGKPVAESVTEDQEIPERDKRLVLDEIFKKQADMSKESQYTPQFQKMNQISWLDENLIQLKQHEVTARTNRNDALSGTVSVDLPMAQLKLVNMTVRHQVGSFSPDQIRALDQYSQLESPGKESIFRSLATDTNLSAETRQFVLDRARKAGLPY